MTITSISSPPAPSVIVVTAPYGPHGPIVAGTSDSTEAIGIGAKALVMNEFNLGFQAGVRVRASNSSTAWMEGVVLGYSSNNLTIQVDLVGGSGTYSTWNVSVAGQPGTSGGTGPQGPQGIPGGVLISGVPITGQLAEWTNATTIKGSVQALQPLDDDLSAISALAGTNTIYYRSGAGAWSPVTIGANLAFTAGTLAVTGGAGNVSNVGTPTSGQIARWTTALTIEGVDASTLGFQPLDGDLTALAALTGSDTIYYRSGPATWSTVTIGGGLTFSSGTLASSAGGGNVSNSGAPTNGQLARWINSSQIEGVAASTVIPAKLGFHATASADQTGVANETWTKVVFPTAVFNDSTLYNTSLSRWTPPSGRYHISAAIYFTAGVLVGTPLLIAVYKNGTIHRAGVGAAASSVQAGVCVTILDACNGTDYFEIYAFCYSGATATISSNAVYTYFMGAQT